MEVTEELYYVVNSLALAVDMGFMSRAHAALVWKGLLRASQLDVSQNNKGVKTNDTIKKSE